MDEEIEAIECRAAVELELSGQNELTFMPTGLHEITPVAGGIGRAIKVKVDARTADAMEQQRKIMAGKGKRPYFDFNHEDGPASFWPEAFAWRQGKGVIALGEWSRRGKAAVEGKDYRAFSPVFHVDNKRGDPARVICKELADPNMGGLVNNPAFENLPLWAKNAGAAGASTTNRVKEQGSYAANNKGKTEMNAEKLVPLRAKQQELENKVSALVARGADESELSPAQTELKANQLQIEGEELKARNEELQAKVRKRQQEDAAAAVKAAVKKGAILAKDYAAQKDWETWCTADPSKIEILAKLVGHNETLTTQISGGHASRVAVAVIEEEPARIFGQMAKLLTDSKRCTQLEGRRQITKKLSAIYASHLSLEAVQSGAARRMLSFPMCEMEDAIMAADVTDPNLGTLSGTLVTQRTLELLHLEFPALRMFTSDFSDESAKFNQTVITRTIDIPSVVTYNETTGWPTSTTGATDVPITIDHHEGVQIVYNENILASTVRRLFDESARAASYALGKAMVDDLYTNITDANFTHNRVVATSAITRGTVIDIGTDLDLLGVPAAEGNRTLLLYPTAFGKLKQDTAITNLGTQQMPQIITTNRNGVRMVIDVDSFQVASAPNLLTNNGNITGFAGSKSALLIATRVPNDYTAAMPGSSNGSVQVVTNPDIGISVMLVQYVDHKLGTGNSRIALMYGTAAGQTDAGELLKAAAGSGSSRA